jgi:hypothetical protein
VPVPVTVTEPALAILLRPVLSKVNAPHGSTLFAVGVAVTVKELFVTAETAKV